MAHLDSELLRTFAAVAETGSVTDGARRISRSQSATSLQIRKLEGVVGQRLFERHGRGVVLSATGERLLPVAQEITRTLAVTLRELRSDDLRGTLRIGIPDDEGKDILTRIVGEFAQSHPLVELDVTCALSAAFPEALASGALDIAVFELEHPRAGLDVLREEQTCWMVSRHHELLARDPVPIALFDRACWWRDAAMHRLSAMERPFRIVYSSQSVAGVAAAIEAGIAIGLLGMSSASDDWRRLGPQDGFGETPVSRLVMGVRQEADGPEVRAMQRTIRQAYSPTQELRREHNRTKYSVS